MSVGCDLFFFFFFFGLTLPNYRNKSGSAQPPLISTTSAAAACLCTIIMEQKTILQQSIQHRLSFLACTEFNKNRFYSNKYLLTLDVILYGFTCIMVFGEKKRPSFGLFPSTIVVHDGKFRFCLKYMYCFLFT